MNLKEILERVAWFFSRWWAHTRALIKVPQFWITLAVLIGLSVAFAYFATESSREFFMQSYHYVRAGEYKKGWKEFEKTFGVAPKKEMPRAGQGARAGVPSKPGEKSQPAGNAQRPDHRNSVPSGRPSGSAGDSHRQRSSFDLFGKISWEAVFALLLSVLAVRVLIYAINLGSSFEVEFKWRNEDPEDTEPPGSKDPGDLGRRKPIKVVGFLEIFKKIKMSFNSAHHAVSRPSGKIEKIPYDANDITTGAVCRPVPSFAAASQRMNSKLAWVVHLVWFLIGFYILFLVIWLILGAFFLF